MVIPFPQSPIYHVLEVKSLRPHVVDVSTSLRGSPNWASLFLLFEMIHGKYWKGKKGVVGEVDTTTRPKEPSKKFNC